MRIERFETPGLAQYSYIVSNGGQAIVIDPMRDFDRYTGYAAAHGLKIVHVTETHIHADFASGAAALATASGAELALSAYDRGEQYHYQMGHRSLRDGDVLTAGWLRLQAIYTPGHTPEHLSFLLFDTQRSKTEAIALFTGDFLFVGGVGRPDLLGETAKEQLAHELFSSLHKRIAHLSDGIQLYPAHGAGSLCGIGMSEHAESTLGYERATNPLFKLKEEEFIRQTLATVPPIPSYYPRMKALNAIGASNVSVLPGACPLTPAEFAERMRDGNVTILDVRRPEAFGGAHIPGSINIGAGQNLSLWAGWLLSPSTPILLVSGWGDDEDSRRALVRVGLDHIDGFLVKGMISWLEAGRELARTDQLSTEEMQRRRSSALVLDVRSDVEWRSGHLEGARHIMLGDLPRQLDNLPKDRPLLAICGSGYRSSIATSVLQKSGILQVGSMAGGMTAWTQRDLPLTSDSGI